MKASEFRIGNWIASGRNLEQQETWVIGKVHSISSMESDFEQLEVETAEDFTWFFKDGYWGIPLTEEILLDCGFFKYNNAYVLEVPKESVYEFNFSIWDDFTYNSAEFPVELKHLHQLQNLYFALTNKELNYDNTRNI